METKQVVGALVGLIGIGATAIILTQSGGDDAGGDGTSMGARATTQEPASTKEGVGEDERGVSGLKGRGADIRKLSPKHTYVAVPGGSKRAETNRPVTPEPATDDEGRAEAFARLSQAADAFEGTNPKPTSPPGGTSNPTGGISHADINEAVGEVIPRMQECYDAMRVDFPEAAGDLNIRLMITVREEIGDVDVVELKEDEASFDSRMNACLNDSLKEVTIPIDAKEGEQLMIGLPFTFADGKARRKVFEAPPGAPPPPR